MLIWKANICTLCVLCNMLITCTNLYKTSTFNSFFFRSERVAHFFKKEIRKNEMKMLNFCAYLIFEIISPFGCLQSILFEQFSLSKRILDLVDPARTFESVHRTITKTIKTLTQRGAAQQAELTVNDTLYDMIPVFQHTAIQVILQLSRYNELN